MSDIVEEFFLEVACETPLPTSRTSSQKADSTPAAKPVTRAQAKLRQQAQGLPGLPQPTSTSSRKRSRKSDFNIFVDADTAEDVPAPSPKKSKPNARVPLAEKVTSANEVPVRVPGLPTQPFHLSPSDPLWENVENYYLQSSYRTPPSTPGRDTPLPRRRSSTSGSPFSTPGAPFSASGVPTSTPPLSPFASPLGSARTSQPRRAPATKPLPLPAPHNMVLYDVLHLNGWRVTEAEIKTAYKQIAKGVHPDKVAEELKEDATQFMQTVNAAKEVLLDSKRRRAYHINGKLPWAT